MARPIMLSTSQKYAAKMKTVTRTTVVVVWTFSREGQITLRISLRTSFRKSASRAGVAFRLSIPVLLRLLSSGSAIAFAMTSLPL